MNKPPAFQFYPDDFIGGVADMTQSEVGAYILLLCQQWNRGSIPVEPDRQQLLAKGSVSEHVLAKFEKSSDGMLRNERMEKERAKQAAFREKQREKGIKSGIARGTTVEPRLNHGSQPVEPSGQPEPQPNTNSPSPSPSPSPKEKKEGFVFCPVHEQQKAVAEEIYQAYPLKVSKPTALRAIRKAMQDICPACLLGIVQAYAAQRKGNETEVPSVPHPATWFNQQRFNDAPETWGPSQKCSQGTQSAIDKVLLNQNLNELEKKRGAIKAQYDGHQSWTKADIAENKRLKGLIDDLKTKLGIVQ
jgi:uncharacterized protein YdaU (DUF1376 family)